MTAILGAIHQQIPFMIGDVMVSSPKPPKGSIIHPMTGLSSVDAPVWWDTMYTGDWRQKLIKIGEHLMVAWSGSLIEARAAIKAIRAAYANIDSTDLAQIEGCTKVVDALGIKNTDLIFLIANPEGWRLRYFGKTAVSFKTNWSENAVASGSGFDALVDVLDVEAEFNDRAQDEFNRTLGQLVMAAARMWFFDLTGVGQTHAFGGCYEMAIRQNNAVVKVDDVLFASHVYRPEEGIALLPYFLKIESVVEGRNYSSVSMHSYNTVDRPIRFEYAGGELPSNFFLSEGYLKGVAKAVAKTLDDAGEPVPDNLSLRFD